MGNDRGSAFSLFFQCFTWFFKAIDASTACTMQEEAKKQLKAAIRKGAVAAGIHECYAVLQLIMK